MLHQFESTISYRGYIRSIIISMFSAFVTDQQNMTKQKHFFGICDLPTAHNIDPVFCKAYHHFKLCTLLKFTYLFIKAASSFSFFITTQSQAFKIWLWLLFTISLIQIPYLYKLLVTLGNKSNLNQIASCLGFDQFDKYRTYRSQQIVIDTHRSIFTYNNDSQKISKHLLVSEIEACIQKLDANLAKLKQLQFILYQLVQLYGAGILIYGDFTGNLDTIYLITILYIGTYEYIEDYLCFAYGLVYFSSTFVFDFFSKLIKKWKSYRLNRSLKSVLFTENIQGSHECQICLQAYEDRQELIVLCCSELHHFHAACIRQWITTSFTCPVCRATIFAM